MAKDKTIPRLIVQIKSPDQVYFEGEVDALTSTNEKGTFDVLPLHANFISIIKHTIILYKGPSKIREMPIDSAVLKVVNNTITIFLGIGTPEKQENTIQKEIQEPPVALPPSQASKKS